MVVYLDLLFGINFFMDLGCLWLVGRIFVKDCKRHPSYWPAALIGATFVCLWILIPVQIQRDFSWLAGFAGAVCMCKAAFRSGKCSQLVLQSMTLMAMGFLLSGLTDWLYQNTFLGYWTEQFVHNRDGSLLAVGLLTVSLTAVHIWKKKRKTPLICRLTLLHGKKKHRVYALVDTGNCLTTNDGRAVHILELSELQDFLPELYNACLAIQNKNELNAIQQAWLEQFSFGYLPFHSAGGDGIFAIITLEEAVVERMFGNEKWIKPVFALQPMRLQVTGTKYHAIIHQS